MQVPLTKTKETIKYEMEQLEKKRFQVMHTVYLFRWFQHNMDFALLNRNHYCNVDDFSYFEYFR